MFCTAVISRMTDYRQDEKYSIPSRGKEFFSLLMGQTDSETHPPDTRSYVLRCKAAVV
jgi:hypothetical protein